MNATRPIAPAVAVALSVGALGMSTPARAAEMPEHPCGIPRALVPHFPLYLWLVRTSGRHVRPGSCVHLQRRALGQLRGMPPSPTGA